MKLYINYKLLTDSPYDGSQDFNFNNTKEEIDNLTQDILLGNSSCYLVSGYRGAGKSSFVKKIEIDLDEKLKNKTLNDAEVAPVLFVYSSFTKYKNHTFLIRKLIRDLYYSIHKPNYHSVKKHLEDLESNEKDPSKQFLRKLSTIFQRTFNDVSQIKKSIKNSIKIFKYNIEISEVILNIIKIGVPFLIQILWSFNIAFNFVYFSELVNTTGFIALTVFVIFNTFKITYSYSKSNIEEEEYCVRTLYDDEIADHHFYDILNDLYKSKIKVVYVLDELDKVDDDDVNNLLKEMKPYLVSGLASFIVVAGQQLFYKYHLSLSSDDSILSSLFSRKIHVPLLTLNEFKDQFSEFFIKDSLSQEEIMKVDSYLYYLFIKSKRVPRRCINIIRQDLNWEKDIDKAFIEINDNIINYDLYKKIVSVLNEIDDIEIQGNYEGAIADFINMHLYITVEKILNKRKGVRFTLKELLNEEE